MAADFYRASAVPCSSCHVAPSPNMVSLLCCCTCDKQYHTYCVSPKVTDEERYAMVKADRKHALGADPAKGLKSWKCPACRDEAKAKLLEQKEREEAALSRLEDQQDFGIGQRDPAQSDMNSAPVDLFPAASKAPENVKSADAGPVEPTPYTAHPLETLESSFPTAVSSTRNGDLPVIHSKQNISPMDLDGPQYSDLVAVEIVAEPTPSDLYPSYLFSDRQQVRSGSSDDDDTVVLSPFCTKREVLESYTDSIGKGRSQAKAKRKGVAKKNDEHTCTTTAFVWHRAT